MKDIKDMSLEELKAEQERVCAEKDKIGEKYDEVDSKCDEIQEQIYALDPSQKPKEVRSSGGCIQVDTDFD